MKTIITEKIQVYNSSTGSIHYVNTVFKDGFSIIDAELDFALFDNCDFDEGVVVDGLSCKKIIFRACTFGKRVVLDNVQCEDMEFSHCVDAEEALIENSTIGNLLLFLNEHRTHSYIELVNCSIKCQIQH